MVVTLIGGIGLFLLGMVLMTDALKAMAGDALRQILSRFVAGPFTAITSGALSTVLVQSSSATTLTTIGFVSAGLITFPQAVGVIMGANLGTTSIGWIVSVLGFRFDITALTLPLIAAGAMMRLLLRAPWSHLGIMLAGFGLIFVGIGTMQQAMDGVAGRIDLHRFAEPTIWGKLVLVAIGVAMTVLLQASGAALAMTLAALFSGAINLEQAAALVIGQNVGTTVKVLVLAIGARVAVKRTAAAHILFNVVTGAVAFALLGPFVRLVAAVGHHLEPQPGVLTLAAFHTAFNVLGVLLFLPWLGGFARLVSWLIPERGSALTRHLDRAVATVPEVAVEAARRSAMAIGGVVTAAALDQVTGRRGGPAIARDLDEAAEALAEVRRFLARVDTARDGQGERSRAHRVHLSTLHALEHLTRLTDTLRRREGARQAGEDPALRELSQRLRESAEALRNWLADESLPHPLAGVEATSRWLAQQRRDRRPEILRRTAGSAVTPDAALGQIDALNWLDRVGYHLWRIANHLSLAKSAEDVQDDSASGRSEPLPTQP